MLIILDISDIKVNKLLNKNIFCIQNSGYKRLRGKNRFKTTAFVKDKMKKKIQNFKIKMGKA